MFTFTSQRTLRHKIRAPRRSRHLDEALFDTTWPFLKNAMFQILGTGPGTISFEEVYRATFKLSHDVAMAEELHKRVTNFAQEAMRQISRQLQAHHNDQLLSSFVRCADQFTTVLPFLTEILMYLDRKLQGRSEKSITLFRSAWDIFVFSKLEEELRYATWKTVVTRPKDIIKHPVIQDIIDSFQITRHISSPINAGLRPIFLVTRPLDFDPPLPDMIPSLKHWGVVVEDRDNVGTLYEITKVEQRLAIPDRRRFGVDNGPFRVTGEWSRACVGYTALSNMDIWKIAQTIGYLQLDYWITSDNCQKFCVRLFQCIRIPLGIQDVFEGLDCVPKPLSAPVYCRRLREFENFSYFRQTTWASQVYPLPMSIETFASALCLIYLWQTLWHAILLRIFLSSSENNIFLSKRLPRLSSMAFNKRLELIYRQLNQIEEVTDLHACVTGEARRTATDRAIRAEDQRNNDERVSRGGYVWGRRGRTPDGTT